MRRRKPALERREDLILGRPLKCLLVARTWRISLFALEAPGGCLVTFQPLELASTAAIPRFCWFCLSIS